MAHVRLQVCDTLRGCSLPISGLTAKLCAKLDAGCATPQRTTIPYANGIFEFDVPTGTAGFDGYIQVSSPTELCTNREVFGDASASLCALVPQCDPAFPDARCLISTFAPALRFFNPPIMADAEVAPLSMASRAASLGIARASGAVLDPTAGTLLVTAVDCDGLGAAGIAFTLGEPLNGVGQVLYLENNIPSSALHETDATGTVVFIGLPAGFVNVTGRDGTGRRIGSVGAQLAAASNSFTTLLPSP